MNNPEKSKLEKEMLAVSDMMIDCDCNAADLEILDSKLAELSDKYLALTGELFEPADHQ